MADQVERTSDIHIRVSLDDQNHPLDIAWQADDAPHEGFKSAKALNLALWDAEETNSMRIDLWTNEMFVEEMNESFYQTFRSMADVYLNATGNKKLADEITEFGLKFGELAQVIKRADDNGQGNG